MINSLLKMMISCFCGHSVLSKYCVKCIDFFLLETEHLLVPKLAPLVRARFLFNPSRRTGQNKPADLEKENEVKELKKKHQSIGANKTENSIQISKAVPIIKTITSDI